MFFVASKASKLLTEASAPWVIAYIQCILLGDHHGHISNILEYTQPLRLKVCIAVIDITSTICEMISNTGSFHSSHHLTSGLTYIALPSRRFFLTQQCIVGQIHHFSTAPGPLVVTWSIPLTTVKCTQIPRMRQIINVVRFISPSIP